MDSSVVTAEYRPYGPPSLPLRVRGLLSTAVSRVSSINQSIISIHIVLIPLDLIVPVNILGYTNIACVDICVSTEKDSTLYYLIFGRTARPTFGISNLRTHPIAHDRVRL